MGYNQSSITNAYATGAVTANDFGSNVGGLVGGNKGDIANAYATGAVTANSEFSSAGGLVGDNIGSISKAYATGKVTANGSDSNVGGLVGDNLGSITNAYWDTETSNQNNGAGPGISDGIKGLTSEQMKQTSSFNGFDIDDAGGTGKVWRIYEGQTTPLLRSFLTQVDLSAVNKTTTYNGQNQTLAQVADLDPTKLLTDNSASSINAGIYNADYYSNQQGYDLIGDATLTINKRELSLKDVRANSKTYDGTTNAIVTGSLDGLVSGESLGLDISASFADKNAGEGKAVTVSGDLSDGTNGGLASNYTLINPTGLTASIKKASITQITGITANDRPFDGTRDVTLNTDASIFTGIISGDQLTVATATGQFADAQAEANKTVYITELSLGGSDANNYELTNTTASTTASIIAAPTPNPTPTPTPTPVPPTPEPQPPAPVPTPTPEPSPAPMPVLTRADYRQAIHFRRPQPLPVTTNLESVSIEVIDGGINTTGIIPLTGAR